MNSQNFNLNGVFKENAKEYQTKPVRAAKYQPGMENGFMMHYSNVGTKEMEAMLHEGVRFFTREKEAWKFISINEKQYAKENGALVGMDVEYEASKAVLLGKIWRQNIKKYTFLRC